MKIANTDNLNQGFLCYSNYHFPSSKEFSKQEHKLKVSWFKLSISFVLGIWCEIIYHIYDSWEKIVNWRTLIQVEMGRLPINKRLKHTFKFEACSQLNVVWHSREFKKIINAILVQFKIILLYRTLWLKKKVIEETLHINDKNMWTCLSSMTVVFHVA